MREHLKLSNAGITLSLVIPATYVDYKCFGKQTLENIKRNWEKPDEVIFVITGTPDSEPKGFFQGTLTYDNQLSVPLLMSFTAKVANQATSKNNGARLAKGTLIQFFDMDDVLSPWAIFSVKRAYLLNPKPLAGIMFSHAPTSTVGVSRFSRVPSCTLDRKLCSGIAHARRSFFRRFVQSRIPSARMNMRVGYTMTVSKSMSISTAWQQAYTGAVVRTAVNTCAQVLQLAGF